MPVTAPVCPIHFMELTPNEEIMLGSRQLHYTYHRNSLKILSSIHCSI